MLRDRDRLRERLGAFGISDSAKDWVIKSLDPAAVMSTKGIPDMNACAVMRPEYTVQYTIPTPGGLPSPTWDCYIIMPPGNATTLLYAYGPGGTDFGVTSMPPNCGTGSIALEGYEDQPGFSRWILTPLLGGGVVGPQTEDQFAIRTPLSNPLTFRHIYKSTTIDLIAPAVANQGDVFGAQYAPEFRRAKRPTVSPVVSTNGSGQNLIYLANECALPTTESDLTLSSRNPYVGLAKDGLYMPLKHPGPQFDYADIAYHGGGGTYAGVPGPLGTVQPADASLVQFPQAFYVANNDSGGSTGREYPWVNTAWSNQYIGFDTGYDNTNVGVVIFRGLAAGGGGGGLGASLLVKMKVGLEVCPRPTTASRIYALPPHVYEPRALEAYYAVASEMAAAYPSSYNALGAILPVLSSIASRLFPALSSGTSVFLREMMGDAPQRAARPKITEREVVKTVRIPARSSSVRSVKSALSRKSATKRKPPRKR